MLGGNPQKTFLLNQSLRLNTAGFFLFEFHFEQLLTCVFTLSALTPYAHIHLKPFWRQKWPLVGMNTALPAIIFVV
jgi:hypothetical protein